MKAGKLKTISILVGLLLLSPAYQNCGSQFEAVDAINLASSGSSSTDVPSESEPPNMTPAPGGTPPPPPMASPTPVAVDLKGDSKANLVSSCLTSTAKACLFWKSPVAQKGAPLSPKYSTAIDYSSWQMHAVDIKGYDSSGLLKNTTFEVIPGGKGATADGRWTETLPMLERVSTIGGNFRFANNDPNRKMQQVSAFYWSQFEMDFFKERAGKYWVENRNLKIYSYSPGYNNGIFEYNRKVVILGGAEGDDFSVHGDVITHELGHANVYYASGGAIANVAGAPDADRQCHPSVSGTATCCPTRNGCSKAINEGLADYHTALIFASRPQFGETWGNSAAGLMSPARNVYRDPLSNKNLTADQAYTVNLTSGSTVYPINGEARSMATLYTSIWWEMRQAAVKLTGGTMKELDTIFNEHLATLTGADTFITARDKILAIDLALYSGKYKSVIQGEFTRRGY